MILCLDFSVPGGPPTNVAEESKTNTSVTLTWNKPLCTERNGNIIGYTYSFLVKETSSFVVDNMMTSDITVSLDNLTPVTEYLFIISAKTRTGNGPSATVDVTTLDSGKFRFFLKSTRFDKNIKYLLLVATLWLHYAAKANKF